MSTQASSRFAAIIAAGAVAAAGCSAPGSSSLAATKTTTVTVTQSAAPELAAPVTTTAPTSHTPTTFMATDGTYVVGKDIQPGTYKSSPTKVNGYPFCTWKRLSGFSGEMSDTIAIDNQDGQVIVTIAPTDIAFSTLSCQPWEKLQ